MFDIDAALRQVVESEGSDLHVKVPSPPMIRTHGELTPIPDAAPLTPEDTEQALEGAYDTFLDQFETSDGQSIKAGKEEHEALPEDELEQEQIVKQKRG